MAAGVSYIEPAESSAEAALELAFADPRRAGPLAAAALDRARAARDVGEMSLAQQALGVSARLSGDVPAAVQWLRQSVLTAERGGAAERAAEARLSLSLALAWAGKTAAALHALDRAEAVLRGVQLARLRVQRGIILERIGQSERALAEFQKALPALRRHGDTLWEARALCERGLVSVERGAFAAAEADLSRAESLFRSLGNSRDAAANRHNRGWCAARAGNVPAALEHYDTAESLLSELGLTPGEVLVDRARVLLSAGLAEEALDLAERALERCAGDPASAAEAVLTGAEAALAAGDGATAKAKAADAARRFVRQRRPGWLALAHHTEAKAAWADGERSARLLRLARQAGQELDGLGLPGPASDARLIAARTALDLGRPAVARRLLEEASRVRHRGPAAPRAGGWLAEALLRRADGRPVAAQRALQAGVRVLDEHRMSLGAAELRAHASTAASELAGTGLRWAFESGRADQVLVWTERWRAGALRLRPVLPPDDAALAADLAGLRKVASDLETAATAGLPTRSLLRHQAELEESVRRRTRKAPGGAATMEGAPLVDDVAALLGERTLVELVQFDGQLHAVVVTARSCTLHSLGPAAGALAEAEMARFAIRRLAYGQRSSASQAAAAAGMDHAGRRLDELLLAPLRGHIGDGPLVVVPPGSLHALPWGILPSCRARAVTVAPSAALWSRAVRAGPSPPGRTVFVAGPGLPGAEEELRALARLYPSAVRLAGEEASSAAVCRALDGACLAHLAAHGSFRSDNPLFSSLRLADGPVTGYDLQRMGHAPRQVILSACDSGLAAVRPGDELMGLTAVLFPLGTATLVASVVPVPDEATRDLMIALHQEYVKGASLAEALTAARQGAFDNQHRSAAAAAAFVCFGA